MSLFTKLGNFARAKGTDFDPRTAVPTSDVQAAIEYLAANTQPLDSDLTAIAALSPSNDDVIQRKAGAWVNRTMAQLIADLAALGSTFQPLDSDLTAIAALSTTAAGRSILTYIDPNANALIYWDDSDGSMKSLTLNSTLEFSGDSLQRAALTGDVTASAGSNSTTLANSGVSAGSYTAATVTVDAKGRVTAASSNTIREVLSANRTYYVRTDGSNSNTGLVDSAGGAFLTVQKAIDTVSSLDLSIYDVTIQVRSGTYTTPVVLKSYVGSGTPTILGDTTTPSNVLLHTTASDTVTADNVRGIWNLSGLAFQATTSGYLWNFAGSTVKMTGKCSFGAVNASYGHIALSNNAALNIDADYNITAGGAYHIIMLSGGKVITSGRTTTITGTPAFTTFLFATTLALVSTASWTFSGSATGQRYSASLNAVINTSGGGASFFPGDSAGATATGGQYA